MKWDSLCQSKANGGMGFKDLALFNDALLAKQAWGLLQNKQSLFHKIFKSRFFPTCSFMDARSAPVGLMHGVVYSKVGRSSNKVHVGE